MGVFFRFIVFFLVFYFLIKFVLNLLRGEGRTSENKASRHTRQQQRPHKIQSQEDRIISYQKKKFESSNIEDVEYEEIKEK